MHPIRLFAGRHFLSLLLTTMAWIAPAIASAEVFLVRPDGTGDVATIAEAIDAATDGDVIELADGVFTGAGNRNLDFQGKAITLRSQRRRSGRLYPRLRDRRCRPRSRDAVRRG